MTLEDWRDTGADDVARLYDIEQKRWLSTLGWDTTVSWAIVEAGRQRGYVPGWILRDDAGSQILGWTYYMLHETDLQIGGLTAARAVDVRRLLDRVLDSPEASLATSVRGFVFPAPASLVSALTRRRFAVRRSLYLVRDLTAVTASAASEVSATRFRPFTEHDVFPAMRLLAGAYEGVAGSECFAAHGRLDEWMRYVRQLIDTPACGQWLRDASFVAEDVSGTALTGVVLASTLSPDTAHIAQIVVARQGRGQGIGESLLSRASLAAQASGHSAMTLMVDQDNAPARRLYERQGFTERSAFLYARRRGHVRMPATLPAVRRHA
jgi:ribosomal protein S18 acetylase RimI-like enzyme